MRERTTRTNASRSVPDAQSSLRSLVTGPSLLVLALLLAVVCYAPTLRYGFVYDDVQQIVENPAIRVWNVPQYFTAHVAAGVLPHAPISFYRPLFLIWLRLNYILFKLSPWGWHLTSLLAHLGVVCVFFLLVRQWTKDSILAGWAALLFAVHPIHIESVAWVSAVPELLFTLCGIWAIYAYDRFREEERRLLLGVSIFLYALALLAKETAIIVWPVILVSEYWLDRGHGPEPPARTSRARTKAQLPFLAVSATYLGLRVLALRGIRGEVTHTAGEVLCSVPATTWFYLQKLVLPVRLSQIYFDPEIWSIASPHFYLPAIAVCVVALGLVIWASKSRAAAFAAVLLTMSLMPPLLGVSIFPRHDLAHNRYLYLPSAGTCMLMALALRNGIGAKSERNLSPLIGTSIVVSLSLVLVVVWTQERPYRDNIALFTHSVQLNPESAMAWGLLGEEYMRLGQYQQGIATFHTAQTLEPDTLLNNYRLGAAYYLVQNMPMAQEYFQRGLDNYHDPDVVTYDYALYRLGLSQYAQGKMSEAETTLRRATQLQPRGSGYHLALGATLKYEGNLTEAKSQFKLELQLGADQEASTLLQAVNSELSSEIPH